MSTIKLNGKPHALDGQTSVAALLASLDINPKQVAVAVNGEVVPRDTWATRTVSAGDAIEIVRAVGGGCA
ncbi:MAG TPA: sulfur carrier protein ThiS [Dehalococcoidia bacterium]|nr:sulfur carrier protein ThiS [Dehalococcoidia bacterium]